ncbi:MAG: N-acetylmuramoyl-L-alanine amidase [Pseudomonadota bacterium]
MLKKSNKYISPNYGNRPENTIIDTIVIHYTEMLDDISAINRLCDVEAEVSSHYLVSKKGEIFCLVPDHLRAWHAGPSCWRGKENVNNYSIGIELDNNGREPFSAALMNSLIKLCHELMEEHPIDKFNIVGHSDIIPSRKFDPGRLFNWQILAENGIGVFLKETEEVKMPDITITQEMLSSYGYKIEITGILDQSTEDVMRAFNEHFNPTCLKIWNEKSQGILQALLMLR